jgi:hypothetical protein
MIFFQYLLILVIRDMGFATQKVNVRTEGEFRMEVVLTGKSFGTKLKRSHASKTFFFVF